ncbi:MAG: hypothetical protein ACYCPS_01370 [Candidatus Saccharimonadales bacterium]
MVNSINVDLGSNTTGVNTANPQSVGQDSSIAGQPQSIQNNGSSTSINNQSFATPITLPPVSSRASSIQPLHHSSITHHKVSTLGISIAGILVVLAIVVSVYIYITHKRYLKNH